MENTRRFIYLTFIKPKSIDEDSQRREFILNVLLLGSIALSLAALLMVVVNIVTLQAPQLWNRFATLLIPFGIFMGLYILSRSRFYRLAPYFFLGLYFLLGLATILSWGITIPQGILLFALIIVMAGVLVGTRFAFATTLVIAILLLGIVHLENRNFLQPDFTWRQTPEKYVDAVVFIVTFGVMLLVSWLSNREIERALHRARQSEAELKNERDLLEVKVEERTRDLKEAQIEKLTQLYKFAEMGQMAAGIIHDLANPLAAVSFNLEQLNEKERSDLVKRAIKGTDYMKRFITAARKQMQNQVPDSAFSIVQEIQDVIHVLQHRARKLQVAMEFSKPGVLEHFGNSARFDQVIMTLLTNALDAYELTHLSPGKRKISISISKNGRTILISVQDWAGGVPDAIKDHIFEPHFTTKGAEKGMGIGLTMSKAIIEKDFEGKLTLEASSPGSSLFLVTIPERRRE